ncbi:glycosyl hydrolase family 18 protein [Winslowiella sp. 2C04]|uniref:glycosyl hydrolase family 18 protein n=1 Tax=Winslowiella sp. 2C04 TaxID=3416179 RepID=UPI003CF4974B
MKKIPFSLIIGATLFAQTVSASEQNRTISYLTSWGLHNDDANVIKSSKVDTFLLSFGKWDSEGNIETSDNIASVPAYDGYWMPVAYSTWTQVKLAQPQKKMMIAFGGQTYEEIWSHLNSEAGREKVAKGLVKKLNTPFPVYKKNLKPEELVGECQSQNWDGSCNMGAYQRAGTVYLDGIDFDFEKEARLTEEENDNLLKLSQRVRELLGPDSKKLLSLTTYHVGADPVECMNNTVEKDCSYVEDKRSSHHGEVLSLLAKSKDVYDFFNVMTYDAGRNFRYKVAMANYARAVGDASKIVVGATINKQWAAEGNFVESRQNNIARAEWQAENNYGGFFVWTLGASTEQMNMEDQVDYINEMKTAADNAMGEPGKPGEDDIAPSAPADLNASVQGENIRLSWQRSEDNVGVTGYWIYRNSIRVDVTTTTGWLDRTAQPEVEYSYYVMAVDAAGNVSPASNTVEAKIPQEVIDPIDPVVPVEPVDPVIPVDPVEPVDPTDPSVKEWQVGVNYKAGDTVKYQGKEYRCLQAHSAMQHWSPAAVQALWNPIK